MCSQLKKLTDLLLNADVDIRISAGEAIALLYELARAADEVRYNSLFPEYIKLKSFTIIMLLLVSTMYVCVEDVYNIVLCESGLVMLNKHRLINIFVRKSDDLLSK